MSKGETHVLPLGFDVDRLVVPFLRKDYTPDRIVLVRTPSDPSVTAERESTRSAPTRGPSRGNGESSESRLVRDSLRSLLSELDRTFDGPIEERVVESFHDYETAYAAFHQLLPELAGDADVVHVNVSPLPKAAAIAVNNAVAALREEARQDERDRTEDTPADQTSLADRLETYYIPAEEYHASTLVNELRWMHQSLDDVIKAGREEYFGRPNGASESRIPIYEALTEPLREQVLDVANSYAALVTDIEGSDSDSGAQNQVMRGYDFLEEVREPLTWHEDAEQLVPLDPDTDGLPTYLDRFNDEYELPVFFLNRKPSEALERFSSQLQSLTSTQEVDHERVDALQGEITELKAELERFEVIANWFEELQVGWETTDEVAHTMDRLCDDISKSGLAGECGAVEPLSSPPMHSLRSVEQLVVALLHESEETPFKSAAALSGALADSLTDSLKLWLRTNRDKGETETEIRELESKLAAGIGRQTVVEELQSQMQSSLQSRLQYNLDTLEEKGYISRPTVEGRKRPSIGLTQQGRLKAATLDEHRHQEAAKEVVLNEMKKLQDAKDEA